MTFGFKFSDTTILILDLVDRENVFQFLVYGLWLWEFVEMLKLGLLRQDAAEH